jgi:16S rRNA (guanine(966)-N(2))-methyltransferase RsmD
VSAALTNIILLSTTYTATADRVKQTLFDILTPRLRGASVLDLCAGSGGIGLEALSRGAARVVLVDSAALAVAAIRANLAALGDPQAEVFRQDATVALRGFARQGRHFDIVFLDPPYASGLYESILANAAAVLAPDGVVVAEHFHKRLLPEAPEGLQQARTVKVGDHVLAFFRRA